MRKGIRLVLWGVFVLILLFAVSCSPGPSGSTGGAGPAEPEVVEPTAILAEEGEAATGGGETEAPEDGAGAGGEVPVSPDGVPADVPVPEGAYQLQVVRDGRITSFQVDGTIDDIVGFYVDSMPGLGWEPTNSPDTNVGSIASLLRKNEAGDQLSISMQSNELGGFVRVTVTVTRND